MNAMKKPEFKYRVMQTRKFNEGSLKGLTIEHKSMAYERLEDAETYARNCVGQEFGGPNLGGRGTIIEAWVVMKGRTPYCQDHRYGCDECKTEYKVVTPEPASDSPSRPRETHRPSRRGAR